MAFDQITRNKLAEFVSEIRAILSEDFTRQLQNDLGLDPATGEVADLSRLGDLSDTHLETARMLRETLEHYLASSKIGQTAKENKARKDAMVRIVREQAFTVLNRMCALKMAEARGLLIESISQGYRSKGFRLFQNVAGGAMGETGDCYRCFIFSLFDEFAVDLPILFDRFSPMGRLFPREAVLLAILERINNSEMESLWAEDETIGWIYQYFNSKEERRQMRAGSQAPRNSRELAVRNQFFTPRYVVEFLTDNTLGRIWHEMQKGDTILKEKCRYLVLRPNEIFLAECDKNPTNENEGSDLPQKELLKRPVYVEHRHKKDPRDLKIIDPACGSGHFLLYAFDLLEIIYEEAWNDSESPKSEITGRTIQEDFETIEDLRCETPKLIFEHNLYGIDIDPRAVQIAALALWLRAQRTWKNLGIKPLERPRIIRSNIVTAEPMPGEDEMRLEFTAKLKPRVLGQIVDEIFEKMKLAGEAGSLLKIEEDIKKAIVVARKQWLKDPSLEQQDLFERPTKLDQTSIGNHFDVSGVTNEQFWEQAEDRILEALKNYSEAFENGSSFRRRLFAEDTARGFAFIDLCRKRFDVTLMNPPFGDPSQPSKGLIQKSYPLTKNDIFAAFVERWLELISQKGRLGAITSRAGFFLSSFTKWREEILLKEAEPVVFADLGFGVMDAAMVEAVAYCLEKQN